MSALRTIFHPPASGAWNMAVDDAMLQAASETGQLTLRFYEWEAPTLSLGHFQKVIERQQHPASLSCPLVRRASGGGAIVHDRELTYSLVVSQAASALAAPELYRLVHRSLIEVLAGIGVQCAFHEASIPCSVVVKPKSPEPFLCFQRRTCLDIVCGSQKIVGSAQRRRKGAVLQHGSILLAASSAAPDLPGIQEVTDVQLWPRELAANWVPRLAEALNVTTFTGGLTEGEEALARRLETDRFTALEYASRR